MDTRMLQKLLSDFQKNKNTLDKKMEAMHSKEFTSIIGNGLIEIKANGKSEIISCTISDEALKDKETLQDLVISAVNEVIGKIGEEAKQLQQSLIPKGIF